MLRYNESREEGVHEAGSSSAGIAGSCESTFPSSSFSSLRYLLGQSHQNQNATSKTVRERTLENSYTVGKKIGSGGSCEVFEVRCNETGAKFACKKVRKFGSGAKSQSGHGQGIGWRKEKTQKKETEKLWEEIRLLNQFKDMHRNIVGIIEAFNTATDVIVILQFAAGGELFHALKKHSRFNATQAATIIYPLLDALQFLHKNRTMHRDIKLENILLMRSFTAPEFSAQDVILADFGLAKQFKNNNSDALFSPDRTFTLCGSTYYVAPEVLMGTGYSYKADVWSVGVVLFMLLSDTPPFYDDERTGRSIYDSILTADFSTNNRFWSGVSNESKDLVYKLLTTNVDSRLGASEAMKHSSMKLAVNRTGQNLNSTRRLGFENIGT